MKDEVNINGVAYVRKDKCDVDDRMALKEVINQRLDSVNKEIDNLIDDFFINHYSEIKQSQKHNMRPHDLSELNIYPSAKQLYMKVKIDKEGHIFTGYKMTNFTNKDIKTIKEKYQNNTLTNGWAKKFAEQVQASLVTVHTFIYNVLAGTFDNIKKDKNESNKKKINNRDFFNINKTAKQAYIIKSVKDDGTICLSHQYDLKLNIQQIIQLKNRITNVVLTFDDARLLAYEFNISMHIFARIVYNISIGTFNKYIDEWIVKINASV